MIEAIKKYWIFILLATLATTLAFLWYAKPFKEGVLSSLLLPSLPGQRLRPGIQVSLAMAPQEKMAPVLQINRAPQISEEEAGKIALFLGFVNNPSFFTDAAGGSVYIWEEEGKILTVTTKTNKISFSRNFNQWQPPVQGEFPDPERAKETLRSLTRGLLPGLLSQDLEIKEGARFVSLLGPLPHETAKEEAMFLEVTFTPFFRGTRFVDQDPQMTISKSWIDRSGEIASLTLERPPSSILVGTNYPLKTESEILRSIPTEGRVVSFGRRGILEYEPVEILKVDLSTLSLAYLSTPEEGISHPIFILSGNTTTIGGNSVPTTIYLPAIKRVYYKETQSK